MVSKNTSSTSVKRSRRRLAAPGHGRNCPSAASRRLPPRSGLTRTFCVNSPASWRLADLRHCRIRSPVRTVAETPVFIKYAAEAWSAEERAEFIN